MKRTLPSLVRREMLDRVRREAAPVDMLANARRLREREQAGEKLTPAQKAFWRDALRRELAEKVEHV